MQPINSLSPSDAIGIHNLILANKVLIILLALINIRFLYVQYIFRKKNANKNIEQLYKELSDAKEELKSQFNDLEISNNKLQLSEERYELALQASNDGIMDWNVQTEEFFYSSQFLSMIGYNHSEFDRTKSFLNFIHQDDRQLVISQVNRYLVKKHDSLNTQYRILHKDGHYIWMECNGIATWDQNDQPLRMLIVQKDISNETQWREKIYQVAYYDMLTKLPNRHLFRKQLKSAIKDSISQEKKGALFFIDLDNFKNVNDTLGHKVGDDLLIKISNTLQSHLGDNVLISRFGGDEFLIMYPEIHSEEYIEDQAKIILNIFNNPWNLVEDMNTYITASIGICIYPDNGNNEYEILKKADSAMFSAKKLGKNQYKIYRDHISKEILKKNTIQNALRDALKLNQFELYYQPQYNINKQCFCGLEALIRWNHPKLGWISPGEFIPIAEETSLIRQIGTWVLKTACTQAKQWLDEGYIFETVSVNISPLSLQQSDFIDIVQQTLADTGLPPHHLDIEITETALMHTLELNIKTLHKLVDLGLNVSLDDFGTGYSSLNYLKRLPIKTVKIDRTFLEDMCIDSMEESIIEGIILLAHKMNLTVVAEGVETKEQYELLAKNHCDVIQGYYFARPSASDEASNLLDKV